MPKLPDADEPVAALIARHVSRFDREHRRRKAEKWLPITLDEGGPFGVIVFGDPHMDANGCNWPLLLRHIELAKRPGTYGICVGDKTNNWVGRLVREYADQHTTASDARRLAKWYLHGAGVSWIAHVLGNHDVWNDGAAIYGLLNDDAYYFPHWEARIELWAAGDAWRIHVAHDFRGQSIYNKTHGPSRAAMFSGGAAELYVCGDKHTFGAQSFEIEETGRLVHSARARGYKFHDDYAVQCGYAQGEAGASIFVLFNPHAQTAAGRMQVFADVELGAEILAAMRRANVHRTDGPRGGGKKHGRKAARGTAPPTCAAVRSAAEKDARGRGRPGTAPLRKPRR